MAEKASTGLVVGLLAYVVGQINMVTVALFLFILIDFITGVLGSKSNGEEITDEKKTQGIIKKFGILILWFMSVVIQLVAIEEGPKIGIHLNTPYITLSMTFYLLGGETLSILKNLSKMKVKPPRWLVKLAYIFRKGD